MYRLIINQLITAEIDRGKRKERKGVVVESSADDDQGPADRSFIQD